MQECLLVLYADIFSHLNLLTQSGSKAAQTPLAAVVSSATPPPPFLELPLCMQRVEISNSVFGHSLGQQIHVHRVAKAVPDFGFCVGLHVL